MQASRQGSPEQLKQAAALPDRAAYSSRANSRIAVIRGVHPGAQHIGNRHAVRAGAFAVVADMSAVARAVQLRVGVEQRPVAPGQCLPAGCAEVFVDILGAGHGDDQRIHMRIGQRPAKCRLGEGCAVAFVRAHVVEPGAHEGLHRHHANPERLCPFQYPGQAGLPGDVVEPACELLVEGRILAEVVGDEHHVDHVLVEGVVEAFDQVARVPGHAGEANLALLPGPLDELEPLRIVEPGRVVYGVVEIDIDVVRAEPLQAALQGRHDVFLGGAGRGVGLGGDHDLVAFAAQGVAEYLFRLPAPVVFGRVEIVDAQIEGMMHELLLAGDQAAGAERNVGDSQLRPAEGDVAAYSIAGVLRFTCGSDRGCVRSKTRGQRASLQESPS